MLCPFLLFAPIVFVPTTGAGSMVGVLNKRADPAYMTPTYQLLYNLSTLGDVSCALWNSLGTTKYCSVHVRLHSTGRACLLAQRLTNHASRWLRVLCCGCGCCASVRQGEAGEDRTWCSYIVCLNPLLRVCLNT